MLYLKKSVTSIVMCWTQVTINEDHKYRKSTHMRRKRNINKNKNW